MNPEIPYWYAHEQIRNSWKGTITIWTLQLFFLRVCGSTSGDILWVVPYWASEYIFVLLTMIILVDVTVLFRAQKQYRQCFFLGKKVQESGMHYHIRIAHPCKIHIKYTNKQSLGRKGMHGNGVSTEKNWLKIQMLLNNNIDQKENQISGKVGFRGWFSLMLGAFYASLGFYNRKRRLGIWTRKTTP